MWESVKAVHVRECENCTNIVTSTARESITAGLCNLIVKMYKGISYIAQMLKKISKYTGILSVA